MLNKDFIWLKSRRIGSDRVMAMALAMMFSRDTQNTTRKQENYLIELLQLIDFYEEHAFGEPSIIKPEGSSTEWELESVRKRVKEIIEQQQYDNTDKGYLNSLREVYGYLKNWKHEYDDLPF